jgi:aspartate/methionine/tyrosine aminotransferase
MRPLLRLFDQEKQAVQYRRLPIEVESPEQFGYDRIRFNLAESSVTDATFDSLGVDLGRLTLAYGDHLGKPELRALLASEGTQLSADNVLLTVGAASALFIVNTVLLQPGSHAIIAFPNYATNLETPRAIGANVERLELRFDDRYRVDVERLERMIRPETKLVSLTSPHNPTGATISEHDLRRLLKVIEAKGCHLLLDETYRDMAFGPMPPLAADLSPNAISVSSLSKTYGLPGLRLGWLMCRDSQLFETMLAAKEQIFISTSLVDEEIAYQALLRKAEHLDRIRSHIRTNFQVTRDWMRSQSELEWIEPRGGVVCFPRIRSDLPVDIDRFYRTLNNDLGTFVGPGHWFDSDRRHMRVGYGWPERQALERGLSGITDAARASICR